MTVNTVFLTFSIIFHFLFYKISFFFLILLKAQYKLFIISFNNKNSIFIFFFFIFLATFLYLSYLQWHKHIWDNCFIFSFFYYFWNGMEEIFSHTWDIFLSVCFRFLCTLNTGEKWNITNFWSNNKIFNIISI